ncbi:MAG: hypothetical protein D6678_05225 [Zetaproteobacteria bacterium]|nr:MAG: hypothetical protein D6678_05225 [Zetaproteobacteria bacterium]
MDEEELFAEAMRKVRPIAPSRRIQARPQRRAITRNRPPGITPPTAPPKASSTLAPCDDRWTLCASGVSRAQLRRLAGGQPPVALEVDLHGMTREQALALLAQSIEAVRARGGRVVCIIHGRGRHSQGRPVLKEAVFHWLREGPYAAHVLAAIPQRGSHGGASLVLLRRQGG